METESRLSGTSCASLLGVCKKYSDCKIKWLACGEHGDLEKCYPYVEVSVEECSPRRRERRRYDSFVVYTPNPLQF